MMDRTDDDDDDDDDDDHDDDLNDKKTCGTFYIHNCYLLFIIQTKMTSKLFSLISYSV